MTQQINGSHAEPCPNSKAAPANEASSPIILVAGNKGGIGKSLVSLATVERQRAAGVPTAIFEADEGTPDVHQCLTDDQSDSLRLESAELTSSSGWLELGSYAESNPEHCMVVNTPAGATDSIAKHGQILAQTAQELGRRLVTLFLINRQRWSLEALVEYLPLLPGSTLHVVRNSYFGSESKFELYNASRARERVEAQGGLSLTFPDLADRVTDAMAKQCLSIGRGLSREHKALRISERLALGKWWGQAQTMLDQAL